MQGILGGKAGGKKCIMSKGFHISELLIDYGHLDPDLLFLFRIEWMKTFQSQLQEQDSALELFFSSKDS